MVSADEYRPDVVLLDIGMPKMTSTWTRRSPEERLEVCGDAPPCATLERQFDAYHHDLD